MKKSLFSKQLVGLFVGLLIAVAVGFGYFTQRTKASSSATQTEVLAGRTQANLNPFNSDAKTFRQTLSDMAWGRNRKEGPAIKPEALVQKNAQQLADEAQQQNLMALQARMAYCAQNWQKDPSCGSQNQANPHQ